ncbi:hypothetical protein [Undibacterium sp. WLX3042]|uniref:hypothetical protein n=1 Tax=Undibacterium sp. WLX3042 TaxID=3412686 RepID=UPI003C2C731E
MIIDGNFVFRKPPIGNPAELLFNDETDPALNVSVVIDATLPALSAEILFKQTIKYEAQADITLSPLSSDCTLQYVSGVSRPVVGKAANHWSVADRHTVSNRSQHAENLPERSVGHVTWNPASHVISGMQSTIKHSLAASRTDNNIIIQNANHTINRAISRWQQMLGSSRLSISSQSQNAVAIAEKVTVSHQVMLTQSRPQSIHRHAETIRHAQVIGKRMSVAVTLNDQASARHQDARKAPLGKSKPAVPPVVTPDYTPSGLLLFYETFGDYRDLIFRRTPTFVQTIVVPVKRSYIVLNEVELRRVDGNYLLPATSLQLKIDMDSWTWSFSASLPRSAMSLVEPGSNGDIVILDAKVNGQHYQLIAEDIQSDRQFGQATISVSGRGISAQLSDKYSPTLTFANSTDRTAQQLMNDALKLNGVSLGWEVDWRIEDWLVPAGAWSHYGTYMSAVNEIAAAAGAFIQPDPVAQILRVRAKYPSAPWNWNSTTPDIELPSAVVTKEAVSWTDNPVYNSVYISGSNSAGILGYVKRQGTAGDKLAPMITDALITSPIAARQRGIVTLAETGRNALYSLSLPVLAETGIIEPGSFVRYVDSNTVRGIVKGVAINASGNDAKVRQTIEVRTHG